MKKMLRTKDRILTGLAFMGDFALESYTRSHGFGWNRSWTEALSLKNSTFRSEVHRCLKTGDMEKVIDKNGDACFKLTSPGRESFERLFPLANLSRKPWDGKWRIAVFDIEEEQKKTREVLRRKLVSLGFGKLQDSVYLTPLDVLLDFEEFLKNERLLGKVLVFEARSIVGFNSKSLANEIWHLDKLNDEYDNLLYDLKNSKGDQRKKNELREKYFEILLKDPLLPREFLPENWIGDEVKKYLFCS